MATVEKLSAETDRNEIMAVLERDGCVVITGLLDAAETTLVQQEISKTLEQTAYCKGNFFGFSTKRFSSVLTKVPATQSLATNEIALSVMDHFLLKSCREYQLNLTQVIQIWPGEPAQIVHTDDLMFPFELPTRGDQKMINCMWAVDEFTHENGATVLVPGSHLWPRDRQATQEETAYGEMSAGSLLIYFGSLLHGGGANRSKGPRTGLVISYCLGWLRQAENQYLAIPPRELKTMSSRLRKLAGYFVHAPNLGAVEGQDPDKWLQNAMCANEDFKEFIPDEYHGVLADYRKAALENL